MHKIFLLVFMCNNVIANNEGSYEKYIDLLPEEEKQEFLSRIARRILEGIKSKDTPKKSHVEITDDQLEAQDEFVQKILKEESDNLKDETRQHITREIDENNQDEPKIDNQNENNNDRVESNVSDKEDHIDLTLREGKRQKRTDSDTDVPNDVTYDVIPVKTIYDNLENYNVKPENEVMESSINENIKLEADNKENVTYADKEITATKNEKKSDLKLLNLRKSFHSKRKLGTTQINDFEPNPNASLNQSQDFNTNEEGYTPLFTTVSQEVTDITTVVEDTLGSTQKIYQSYSEEKDDVQSNKTSNVYHNATNNEVSQMEPIEATTNSGDLKEITEFIKASNSDSQNFKVKPLRSIFHSQENKEERSVTETVVIENVSTINSDTVGNLISTLETNSPDTFMSEVKPSNTQIVAKDIKTQDDTQIETKDTKNLGVTEGSITIVLNTTILEISPDLTSVKSNTANDKSETSEILDKDKTILRARDGLDVSQIDDKVQNNNDDFSKLKPYEVYEVDTNQPHFISTGQIKQNDHPLYVPVYNYAPEKAYFRPYNKLGPNIEDFFTQDNTESNNKSKVLNARNRFSGYNNIKKKGSVYEIMTNTKPPYKKQKAKSFEFTKPVPKNILYHNIYYNPYDYADMNYNFDRNLRRRKKTHKKKYMEKNKSNYFPNSNEKDHPVKSMHKSDTIKDHVSAVRKIFYSQKIFGHAPKNIRKANEHFKIGTTSKKPQHKNIAIDYYFERAESNDKERHNQIFRLNEPKFTNIEPLTPKPLNFEIHKSNITEDNSTKEHISQQIREVSFKKLFESMLSVLEDTIKFDNEELVRYDWLKTTVNIRAAMTKFMDLIEQLKTGIYVSPKDVELLKYTIYIFKLSEMTLEGGLRERALKMKDGKETRRAKKTIIKFPKHRIIKEPIKLWKVYAALLLRSEEVPAFSLSRQQNNILLDDFEQLLRSLIFNLNDLHDAIKHISMITDYRKQKWLQDLKDVYLEKGGKKSLAQVILHLSLSKLLDSIEESSTRGVEDDFRSFVKNNAKVVKNSKEECLFVLNVLEEISRINALEP